MSWFFHPIIILLNCIGIISYISNAWRQIYKGLAGGITKYTVWGIVSLAICIGCLLFLWYGYNRFRCHRELFDTSPANTIAWWMLAAFITIEIIATAVIGLNAIVNMIKRKKGAMAIVKTSALVILLLLASSIPLYALWHF